MHSFKTEEGQANATVARTIGLNGPSATASAYLAGTAEEAGQEQDQAERCFSVFCDVPQEEDDDEKVQKDNPLCAAVLVRKGAFDEDASDLLVVHVQGTGDGSKVGSPEMLDNNTVRIPVVRQNSDSFMGQLVPVGVPPERLEQFKREVELNLSGAFGKHMDLGVLDNAFRAMVPMEEKWFIEVTVAEPYHFKKLKKSRLFRHPNNIDVLGVFPLATTEEGKKDVAPEVSLSMPNIAAAAANGGK